MYPSDSSQLIGKVIDGRYEILQCVGEGGMGVVYKARQTSIDRIVAVKMLSSSVANDREWVQRFYNEARACSCLHHPNTIRMLDFGQTRDGQLFMAMEFLDGLSLRQVIAQQAPLDPQRMLKIMMQCCASLSEAHDLGIIHRDIKADNVFLIDLPGSRDHVKLLDFGVAKLMMSEEFATRGGVVFGTPQYMSPEQGLGEPLTPRSDLYGVGILAYEMLTGTVPFNDAVPMKVLQMHLQSPVPPLPPRIPASVQQIVMRALEKDPGLRYPAAGTMIEEAQSVLSSLRSGAFHMQHLAAAGTPDAFSLPGRAAPSSAGSAASRGGPFAAPAAGTTPPFPARPNQPTSTADQPTVLERPSPLLSGRADRPASAAAPTILVRGPGKPAQRDAFQPSGSPEVPRALPYPPVRGGAPADLPTVLLPASEEMVSIWRNDRPLAGRDALVAPRSGGEAMMERDPSSDASALFWILCLLTGLAVGIGAYWLVVALGN